MKTYNNSLIKGTGSYIPEAVKFNYDFIHNEFYDSHGKRIKKPNLEIIEKFCDITGIWERRIIDSSWVTSDMASAAASEAINAASIDKEIIDYIIVAHNWGDVKNGCLNSDLLPCLAARVKHKLGIKNSECVAYDILFGCPGWTQAFIQSYYYINSGDAKTVLIIGADSLSRVSDPHDIDSMLYADGAGATLLQVKMDSNKSGLISHYTVTDCCKEFNYLKMSNSYAPGKNNHDLYLKMQGQNLYKYAVSKVPGAIDKCLKASGIKLEDVSKILIHQANERMIKAIVRQLYKLNGIQDFPTEILPITVEFLGNCSVATIPILLDLLVKNKLDGHVLKPKDIIVFASVGAGMHINCIVYQHS